ncbi:hypothetical protein ACQ1Z8_15680, partial [Enterococcus faecalis]
AINGLFLFFISITLIGAFRSDNLKMSTVTNHFFLILYIAILAIVVLLFSKHAKKWIDKYLFGVKKIFVQNIGLITGIYFIFGFCLQVFILTNISAPIGWDVSAIFNGVSALPENKEVISNYLSINPNNSFFFFLMLGIINLVNHFSPNIGNTWLFWQLLNIVVLDTGIGVLTVAANRLFSKRVSYLVLYLSMFSLALSPWLLVLYTDSLSFMFVSLVLLVYSFLGKKNKHHFICILFLGILCGITFLIKPSAIIFLIAWTIVFIVIFVANYKKNRKYVNILSVCLFVIGMVSSVTTFTIYKNQ